MYATPEPPTKTIDSSNLSVPKQETNTGVTLYGVGSLTVIVPLFV